MNTEIWMGSEASYLELQETLSVQPDLRSGPFGPDGGNPVQVEVIDGVAVLHIVGPLVSRGNWITRLFEVISYVDIENTLSELAGDKNVRAILMNYDTPGGSAKGCKQCAAFIRDYAESVKPVFSFTSGTAASAGMWLYSAGLGHFADEDSQVGSVGAILVHTEQTELDKNIGFTRKVFRSAPYKALGSPYEKLSKDAEAMIEEELDFIHRQFVEGIAEYSDLSVQEVSKKVATGKLFRAPEAHALGLVDQVLPFGQTVVKLANQYRADSSTKR